MNTIAIQGALPSSKAAGKSIPEGSSLQSTGAAEFQSIMSQLLGQGMSQSAALTNELPSLADTLTGTIDGSMLEDGLAKMLSMLDRLQQADVSIQSDLLQQLAGWQQQLQALLQEMLPAKGTDAMPSTVAMAPVQEDLASTLQNLKHMLQEALTHARGSNPSAVSSMANEFKALLTEFTQMIKTAEILSDTVSGKVSSVHHQLASMGPIAASKRQNGEMNDRRPSGETVQPLQGLMKSSDLSFTAMTALQRLGMTSSIKLGQEASGMNEAKEGSLISSEAGIAEDFSSETIPTWMKLTKDWSMTAPKAMEAAVKMPMTSFAEDFARFAQTQMKLSTLENGMAEARIRLMPEHLGQLDIRITTHQGQITAHFTAESLMAKEMLEGQMNQLRTSLTQQGLQVDKITITQTAMSGGGLLQDGQKRQSFSQSNQQHKSETSKLRTEGIGGGYDQWMEEEMTRMVQSNRLDPGQQFDATA
jgi:flagellar hook-length control protein FliK